jgi:hypothetical protein
MSFISPEASVVEAAASVEDAAASVVEAAASVAAPVVSELEELPHPASRDTAVAAARSVDTTVFFMNNSSLCWYAIFFL